MLEEQEIPLPPLLDEFRTALREEIEAARKNASSSAVPLSNGRRIAKVGGGFQYLFVIDNVLNVPDDTPGDLIVPGKSRVEATIISVDGLAITISVTEDLGEFVPTARLQSDLTFLLRKLIERLEAWRDRENPAGDRLLGAPVVSSEPVVSLAQLAMQINPDQAAAVASALGRSATFIWGPPGTGKTRTIGVIGQELLKMKRSLLLVSHTNVAVDQALLRIADKGFAIEEGSVIRVGAPKDKRLIDRQDLLLEKQVQRKSAEFVERKGELEAERERKSKESVRLQRVIAVAEWTIGATPDIRALELRLEELHRVEKEANEVVTELPSVAEEIRQWKERLAAASDAQQLQEKLDGAEKELAGKLLDKDQKDAALQDLRRRLGEALALLNKAQELEPRRERFHQLPSVEEIASDVEEKRARTAETLSQLHRLESDLEQARTLLDRSMAVGPLMRRWKRLPKPEEQAEVVANTERAIQESRSALLIAEAVLRGAEDLWREATELEVGLRPFKDVPRAASQLDVVESLRRDAASLDRACGQLANHVLHLSRTVEDWTVQLEAFHERFGADPQALTTESSQKLGELEERRERSKALSFSAVRARKKLEEESAERLTVLEDWGLVSFAGRDAEAMVTAIVAAHEKARRESLDYDMAELRQEVQVLNARIKRVAEEIEEINETLKHVEDLVIAEATVVATTLTRAYLRDSIQKRRFDTVLLDEASMAPVPALWMAAALADTNIVVVGDFRQLPPIVQSSHEVSKKWLGQDVFEISGIRKAYDAGAPQEHFVTLRKQYRMHPSICEVSNTLFYEKLLVTDPSAENDGQLSDWYLCPWEEDRALSVIDTGRAGAWVTSVTRGGTPSRLNFLSASICVDLVETMMRNDRPKIEPGDSARVLIICPYRPHARLLGLLLREQGLEGEVIAGTVHSFQGSEADVVILDLVNDEPHWRVSLFDPRNDENTRRLFNVALTRARRRLIIVGDLTYIEKLSKKAFLGRQLIPFLRTKASVLEALDVTGTGLAARAAASQMAVLGGEVESTQERIVVRQDDFYRYLLSDLQHARNRVIIYSPFITESRLAELEPQLKACVERGVATYVLTKTVSERPPVQQVTARRVEKALGDWGVVIIHKRGMHEKLVFIDDRILWSGSLNPLSYSNTQEIMERRVSRMVVSDYAGTLKLEDLVGAITAGETVCPICGSELIADEGRDEPFYWSCTEVDCFSRSIGRPMPVDGRIVCSNCGAPVEFGQWGQQPAWRCTVNSRHRQRIARSHLKLPRMRELIPPKELRKLEKSFAM
jgi:hypothetical protein